MSRNSGRKDDEKRQVEIITGFNPFAEGSCLIKCGNTHVVCTATVEDKVPSWLKGQEKGWVTAEYAMLPRATLTRVPRETACRPGFARRYRFGKNAGDFRNDRL